MTGIIFNIQRFSINDGPGIRTTVFLKGCPLRCSWCHNPESISPAKEIILSAERCIRCGDCYRTCKNNAIDEIGGNYITMRERCVQCGECIDLCFSDARGFAGKELEVDQVMAEIRKDVAFYSESKGGVTFSGGEPLLQHAFLKMLLKECNMSKIHTAVDTSGYAPAEILAEISQGTDLFLYDIKAMTNDLHISITGVSNQLILDNLKNLAEWGKNVIVRIPIIPGINDNIDEIRKIGRHVESLRNISEINILPYHKSGIEKKRRLGAEPANAEIDIPNSEAINLITDELKKYVKTVKMGG